MQNLRTVYYIKMIYTPYTDPFVHLSRKYSPFFPAKPSIANLHASHVSRVWPRKNVQIGSMRCSMFIFLEVHNPWNVYGLSAFSFFYIFSAFWIGYFSFGIFSSVCWCALLFAWCLGIDVLPFPFVICFFHFCLSFIFHQNWSRSLIRD